jgi:hypothetical protein
VTTFPRRCVATWRRRARRRRRSSRRARRGPRRRIEKKAEKAEARARKDAERAARESTKLRKLGIGKAALSASEASLMTDKEARRVETKRKRGAVAGREKDVLAKLDRFKSGLSAGAAFSAKRASEENAESDPANADHVSDGGREGAVGVSRFVSEGLYYAEEGDDDRRRGGLEIARASVRG